ncbi:polyhydroxyalkanoic acid synthase [Halalkalibacter wakoensis JCM 9140]|uniref:Polyhydroxyalkanoic acid synthase n=1 Tax=Halalkalibacter wakoensis JCM 9140 TaxID=1236970 RepID=W4PZ75_9BACI|nr:alpha/beta fold hydrolase [Halalkalibacter wakoensis]GAE24965.1 polyhydroxyalkanoic acid synthase [Halalkalibacter wakoensis JCM 9140]
MDEKQDKGTNRWEGIRSIFLDPVPKVGQTNKETIWKLNKSTLFYYPSPNKQYNTPLFLIYSLINESYILDLHPGISMIEAYGKEGYDVYLLDFGKVGYEDKDIKLDDYIRTIEKAVKRAKIHANSTDISVIGYCLGGTLAVMHAAITKESIKNLVLLAPPINFTDSPFLKKWFKDLKNHDLNMELLDDYGIVPAKVMEWMMRLVVSPLTYSSYLSLFHRANDPAAVRKWRLFNQWVKGHVPFSGAALKQFITEVIRDNKLIKSQLILNRNDVLLSRIQANLLVISTTGDDLVPEFFTKPLMNEVSSQDKTYKLVKGGHVTLAMTGEIPDFLSEWLRVRS